MPFLTPVITLKKTSVEIKHPFFSRPRDIASYVHANKKHVFWRDLEEDGIARIAINTRPNYDFVRTPPFNGAAICMKPQTSVVGFTLEPVNIAVCDERLAACRT